MAGQVKQIRSGVTSTLTTDAQSVREAIASARTGLVGRASLVEVVALAAVAGEHVLVVGPPGTAKSEAVRRIARSLGGSYFEYLLGRFTEPNEVFGPVDLRRLREGELAVETTGMLPEADVVFLDEVFLGSTAILNTLLGILNERTYRRGSTQMTCPLRVCIGATNRLPDDPALAAFADRFLVRAFVDPVPDSELEDLLEAGWALRPPDDAGGDLGAIDRLAAAASACDLDGIRSSIASAMLRLRSAGIAVTDRRAVRTQRLVAAAAVLDGRLEATAADLWPIPLVAPTAAAQKLAAEVLTDLLDQSTSDTAPHAAEAAARSLTATASRLATTAEDVLAAITVPATSTDDRLRVEAVLREIDATFDRSALSPRLADLRIDLLAAIAR